MLSVTYGNIIFIITFEMSVAIQQYIVDRNTIIIRSAFIT